MTFDFYQGARTQSKDPEITLRKSGQMVLTPAAVAMLGDDVTHVQFGYDPKAGAVGLRPAKNGASGRYTLRDQSNGSKLVDGRRFVRHHGIGVEKAQTFPAEELAEGIIGFRLPDEGKADTGKSDTKDSGGKGGTKGTARKSA